MKIFDEDSLVSADGLTEDDMEAIIFRVTGLDGYKVIFTYTDMENSEYTLEDLAVELHKVKKSM